MVGGKGDKQTKKKKKQSLFGRSENPPEQKQNKKGNIVTGKMQAESERAKRAKLQDKYTGERQVFGGV